MVLPFSAISGKSWESVRKRWRDEYDNIIIVTIAGAGSYDSSFSADTGMAECLFVGERIELNESDSGGSEKKRASFVLLSQQVQSTAAAELIAAKILRLRGSGKVRRLEDAGGITHVELGGDSHGTIIDAPLPQVGPWPLAGIADGDLAQVSYHLEHGRLLQVGEPGKADITLPITRLGDIAERGTVDRDINEQLRDGTLRGPFELIKPAVSPVPTYPMLWAHDAKLERSLIVKPDSEGRIKAASGKMTEDRITDKAAQIWVTATRTHYNRDLRFNSQSLIVAMTNRPCIGGRAWPSVIFQDPEHEYAFALWCNSTLGLLMHWWATNKTQSGRGRLLQSRAFPNIPTLDVRTLTKKQLGDGKRRVQYDERSCASFPSTR